MKKFLLSILYIVLFHIVSFVITLIACYITSKEPTMDQMRSAEITLLITLGIYHFVDKKYTK